MTTDGRTPHRGERVVDLRKLLAKTQAQLADETGIPQPNLSRIEKGLAELTDNAAFRIARATGTPLEFFYYNTPRYTADEINFRRKARVSAKGREFVVQAFKEIERIAGMLAHAPARLKRIDLPIAGQFDITNSSDIDAFAVEVRRASGFDDEAPVRNVIRTVERAGVAVAPLSVPTGDNETLLDGHCGMSRWAAEQHCATVAFITGQPTDRQRFTIAHELGHVLLHRHRDVPPEEREAEANLFAGAFLLPTLVAARHVSESLTLQGYMKIKATFGISIQATITRGRRMNLISRQRQKSLMIQISSRGWRKNEPVTVGKESPILLWTELTALHGPNPYFAASREFGIAPRLLEQWVPAKVPVSAPSTVGNSNVVQLHDRDRD